MRNNMKSLQAARAAFLPSLSAREVFSVLLKQGKQLLDNHNFPELSKQEHVCIQLLCLLNLDFYKN